MSTQRDRNTYNNTDAPCKECHYKFNLSITVFQSPLFQMDTASLAPEASTMNLFARSINISNNPLGYLSTSKRTAFNLALSSTGRVV